MNHHIFLRHLSTDKNDPAYDNSEELQQKVLSKDNSEIPVNKEGHEQGRLLEEYFGAYLKKQELTGPFCIIHSGYERTMVTVDYIRKGLAHESIPIQTISVDQRIKDIDHGETNDIPFDKVLKEYPKYAKEIETQGYLDAVPPGGETHRQALGRIRAYIADLEKKDRDTITVTHLSTLILIRWVLEGLTDDQVLTLLSENHPPNASATQYIFDASQKTWKVVEIYKEPWDI